MQLILSISNRREVKPAGPRNWTVSMDATLPGNQHRQLQCLYNNILMNSKQRQVNLGRIRWLLSLKMILDGNQTILRMVRRMHEHITWHIPDNKRDSDNRWINRAVSSLSAPAQHHHRPNVFNQNPPRPHLVLQVGKAQGGHPYQGAYL